jgi:hypothetical protein
MIATHEAVLLADIVESRKLKRFRQIRDAKIDSVSRQRLKLTARSGIHGHGLLIGGSREAAIGIGIEDR